MTIRNPMQWCSREVKLAGAKAEVTVSLYFFGDESPGIHVYEMGVALTVQGRTRRIPLNYTAEAALSADEGGMYETYSSLADDYVSHLRKQGVNAKRVLADFELLLRRGSESSSARS